MKITAIGDIHGKDVWKKIVAKNSSSDKIIFMGDYFDSKDNISTEEQIENFNTIIRLKIRNPNQIVLLFGNHDFQYLPGINEKYSGYQYSGAAAINLVISESLRHLQMCYIYENYLFSHAGVTKTWAASNLQHEGCLEIQINDLFKYKPQSFGFTMGERYDNYGNDITQTPIWVRPESLAIDKLENYIMVVGHTQCSNIEIGEGLFKDIIKIDTLDRSKEYLTIVNNEPIINKL